MTSKNHVSHLAGLLLIGLMILTACGGANDNSNESGESEPTDTPFPTFEFVAPTNPPIFGQDAESTDEAGDESEETVELDPKLVDRGLGRYEALECGTCHGVDGEGTDEAGALNSFSMAEEDFVTFMRSGGELGSEHQYSTDRLSQNGAANLYLYLLSLSQGE